MDIEKLEILRKKARNIFLIGVVFCIITPLILFLITNSISAAFCIFIFSMIITALVYHFPKRKFTLAFKDMFVLKSLKEVFTDLNYMPEKGIDRSIIRNTRMIDMGNRYASNDYISAKYKNINVIQADVNIEEETTDSDGNSRCVTLFKGKWMIFDFNKNFKANIQVCQKRFRNSRISNWGNDLKFTKIMMEDQLFNNQFRVYAQNEHDAFYILTPSLMEKIKNLSNSIEGNILFCFIDNKLHVGLHNMQDSFEPSVFIKINETRILEKISKEIKLITAFVDELDLDNNLFRKEV